MTFLGKHKPQVDKSLLTLVRSDKPGSNPEKKVESLTAELDEIYLVMQQIKGDILCIIFYWDIMSAGDNTFQKFLPESRMWLRREIRL